MATCRKPQPSEPFLARHVLATTAMTRVSTKNTPGKSGYTVALVLLLSELLQIRGARVIMTHSQSVKHTKFPRFHDQVKRHFSQFYLHMGHKYPFELGFWQSRCSQCDRLPIVSLLFALNMRNTGASSASTTSRHGTLTMVNIFLTHVLYVWCYI